MLPDCSAITCRQQASAAQQLSRQCVSFFLAGTGGKPELGEQAAQESQESLAAAVGNADMGEPAGPYSQLPSTRLHPLCCCPSMPFKCLIQISGCPKAVPSLITAEHSLCAGQVFRARARLPLPHICCVTLTS